MIHENNRDTDRQATVLLIMGSVRVGRVCPAIAEWVAEIGRAHHDFTYEIVDLLDWPLPMNDEPGIPAIGPYTQSHTRAWSEKIDSAAAVVFVTPQYNWGYPAVLKNAIDHLYREWRGKPVAIVSYGGHGGGKCAEQLRQVGTGLKMRMVSASPQLVLSEQIIREGLPIDPQVHLATHVEVIEQALSELAAEIASADH